MCDAGIVCNTEPNALQEVVDIPGWMGRLLGGVGLSGSSTPILGSQNPLKQSLSSASVAHGPAIPWRKSNVRHTSNELYVDIIESLSVTIAPSGRVLSALVSGTIAFTAELSGVPDLLLSLTTPGGQQAIAQKVQLPVFHPCVRLARWRESPGQLSFIPPDGRFILAGYEVDLLPIDPDLDKPPVHMEKMFLPAVVDIRKSLGPTGSDFEVQLTLNTNFPGFPARPGLGRGGSGTPTPSFLGGGGNSPSVPMLEEVVVTIPISKSVRNITEMKASRGEAQFSPGSDVLKWHVPTKDAGSVSGTATLRCSVIGYQSVGDIIDDDAGGIGADENLLQGYYDTAAAALYQNPDASAGPSKHRTKKKKKKKTTYKKSRPATATEEPVASSPVPSSKPQTPTLQPSSSSLLKAPSIFNSPSKKTKSQLNENLMPNLASVSFTVRGWLPSGIKVESLTVDPRRSRGLGEGVKPFKGVKYLCVSRRGVERRC
ncbi:hypothetical protein MAP00_001051 [Monascus purpureus]|nr:hypothetical protein MAP00_001051 [Monascus purpureus]